MHIFNVIFEHLLGDPSEAKLKTIYLGEGALFNLLLITERSLHFVKLYINM